MESQGKEVGESWGSPSVSPVRQNLKGQDRKESLPVLGSKEQCPCGNPVGAREAGEGEHSRLRSPVLSLWKWSQAMPGNMFPLRGSGGDGRRPFFTGSPNLSSDSVWDEPAHLSPRLREESSWHLREGEVCGQPWDFSVTIPRPPSPGHLLLWLLGSGPWEGAHLHQREGPSCLSDLFPRVPTGARNCHLWPPLSWDSEGLALVQTLCFPCSQAPQGLKVGMELVKRRS